MKSARLVGIILIVVGALSLAYDRFTYTKEEHKADLGPLSFSVKEKNTVHIPMWAGIIAIAAGLVVIAVPMKRA